MNNMDLNELELYELLVDGEDDGVFAVSAVSSPAIERGFIYMNKQEINLQSVSDEKRLVAGPLLIPNKKILRVNEDGIPYSIFFSPETIETIARKFMKNKFNGEVTVEHDRKVDGVYLTENWLIDETKKDKSNQYGFMLPKGTWFGIYKVENDKVWEQIKSGELKGFSVEAYLEHKVSNVNPKQLFSNDTLELSIDDLTEEQAKELLNRIHEMLMPTMEMEGVNPSIPASTYPGEIKKDESK